MEALLHSASMAASIAASSLLSAIWEGSVLAVCVFFCLRLLPGLSSAARSLVWMNVFLLLVVLHVLPLVGIHGRAGHFALATPVHTPRFELSSAWAMAIAGIWASLSLFRAVQLIWGAIRLHQMAQRATMLPVDAELSALLQTRTVAGKVRAAELCTSTEVERPSVFGFLRPRILLPPDLLSRLSSAELHQVVIHEMEHLHRGDDWTNLLQKLTIVFFPLNPALLWVERRLCAERELACDDSVLRTSCGRKAYAICLTRLAEHSMLRRSLSLALGAWERQSELVRRVHRILRRPAETLGRKQTMALTASLSVCVMVAALALARSPKLVGFVEPLPTDPPTELQAQLPGSAHLHNSNRMALEYGSAHMQMAKAILPENSASGVLNARPANTATPVRRNAVLRAPRRCARTQEAQLRSQQAQQAWVVMTSWNETGMMSQMVLTTAHVDQPATNTAKASQDERTNPVADQNAQKAVNPVQVNGIRYAAVRLPYGWLILQIKQI